MCHLRTHHFVLLLLLSVLSLLAPSHVQAEASSPTDPGDRADVANLSLEELMNVKVTSVSRKEENLAGAPAAIYIITSDDIKRSGMSSLPEVLRLAPGVTVQQTNSHVWTVSTRGFNAFPNEKMLVLIDGRAVYDPLYGGVYWDVQNVRLADIERIEVIRGSGGALWGVNAVNGIINVITKPANETQGTAMDTSLGADEGYQGSYRYGGRVGKAFAYRAYGQSSYWDPAVDGSGAEIFNDWHMLNGGAGRTGT